MKIYGADLSPFVARCRIQIYAKGLDIEQVPPPGGLSSDEYKAKVNPTGKIPALDVDGQILAESEVICEYLEDAFPTPSLRPDNALERARGRMLSRAADLYCAPPLAALFGQVNPQARDAEVVKEKLAELSTALDTLEKFLGKGPYAVGSALTLADCALAPLLFFTTRIYGMLGGGDPLDGRPKLGTLHETLQKDPHVARVYGELDEAMKTAFGGS